jgi:ATP-dependent Clp protease ATP-binding subunit ClpX
MLLDTMYDLPSMDNVRRVVVDEAVVTGDSAPYMLFDGGEPQRAASDQ